ncbi:arsenate reductase (glutaredoxin) [Halocola ammonii]
MSDYTIFHNPRCKKSRDTLAILKDENVDPEIVEYLKTPPSEKELETILAKLNLGPQDIIRKGETIFKEKFKGKNFTNGEWITILVENPKLIERPIVVKGNKAVIGRPPENVKELI